MGEKSPDRADAAVWALTELMIRTGGVATLCPPVIMTRLRPTVGSISTLAYLTSRI